MGFSDAQREEIDELVRQFTQELEDEPMRRVAELDRRRRRRVRRAVLVRLAQLLAVVASVEGLIWLTIGGIGHRR